MRKQGRFLGCIFISICLLSGCVGSIWTGATMVYDRHNVYRQLNDYHLIVDTTNALFNDNQLKCQSCSIDIAAFNGDVLVAGHLPTVELYELAKIRLSNIKGYRRLFNQLKIMNRSLDTLQDSWITAKIRSQIFADDTIDPKAFKVITIDRIVYLMGDVKPEEAEKVIRISRQTNNVEQVVKILKYYTYESSGKVA